MRTTIELSDPIFKRLKEVAEKRGLTLRRLVEEAVRQYVAEDKVPAFRLENASFRGDGLAHGLDWSDWDRIRELSHEGRGG
jgi:predicted transcriptional regulator